MTVSANDVVSAVRHWYVIESDLGSCPKPARS